MTSHEHYDKILRELPKDKSLATVDLDMIDATFLEDKGLIEVTWTATGEIYAVQLTREGMIFISEGGFAEQNRIKAQLENDAELQRQNWITTTEESKGAKRISIISIVIAGLSLIVAAIALLR